MTRVRRVVAVVVLVAAGFAAGWAADELTGPGCPAEDSCVVDYHDGGWHITEVTP